MQLLNLGCGATRPGHPWINVDNLITTGQVGEEGNRVLRGEDNYLEADIAKRLPIASNLFDGVLLSHVLEHFDAREGLALLLECKRVLKPGGTLLISVPDASYFRKVMPEDCNANWPRLFGVTDPNNPIPTWHEAALWFEQHKAILTEDAVWCYLARAGFAPEKVERVNPIWPETSRFYFTPVGCEMIGKVNRKEFSLVMAAVKS